ncbi:acyltransferase family protein [Blastococcus brunescens]|uniref:Acyltransferase family protein n=1 Tax=Blastococcus brunescens TaxID=1564165 RepID=A0ABZ1B2V8_9ACTN|nr:acyltransferase family protein [Blastococcus sp. BMG 8361]WRL65145.1 acyltransferase family protein [Blastococcus sp. BMG 8361]
MLLALVSVHWPERFERLRRRRWVLLAVLAAGVVHLVLIGKLGVVGSTVGFTVAYLTASALLLLLYRAAWVPRARWVSVPMALLGRYSYGIYIWHVFAAAVALDLLSGAGPEPSSVTGQLVRYGAAMAVGMAATAAVEKPVLRLRERLLPARRPVPGRAAPVSAAPLTVPITLAAPPTVPIPLPVRRHEPTPSAQAAPAVA